MLILFAVIISLFFFKADEIAIFAIFIVIGMIVTYLLQATAIYEFSGELLFGLLWIAAFKSIVLLLRNR